jgi:uncharacterized RDD family membrane protein YckC
VSLRRLQLALIAVGLAALVVMAGLFSTGVRVACLVAVVAGAWWTEPERGRRWGGWWILVGLGAALAVVGFVVAELSERAETPAGIAAIVGCALVVIGATIGFPVAPKRRVAARR